MIEEQVQQQNARSDLHNLNIKEVFFKYVRFWPLFVVSIALAMVGAWAYLRWSTEVYQSSGILLVQSENDSRATDKLEEAMMVDRMKDVQTEMEVLKSRPMMERVVKSLNLNWSYYIQGNIKERNAYKDVPFELQPVKINDSARSFAMNIVFKGGNKFQLDNQTRLYSSNEEFSTPDGTFKLVITKPIGDAEKCKVIWTPTQQQAIALIGGVEVTPKQNTGILNILMQSTSQLLAADVVNQLMKEYRQVNIEDKNQTTYQQLQFIDKRLIEKSHELDSINNVFVAYKEKYKLIDPQTQGSAFIARIEESNKTLNEQLVQQKNLLRLQQYLTSSNSEPVPSSLGIEEPTLVTLTEEYNKAQMQRKALMENAPPGNPMVQQKTQEVEALKGKILEHTKNIRAAFGNSVGSLQSVSGSSMSQISAMPAKERRLTDIQRDLESKAFIYNSLLATREEKSLALASTISNTKILQDALVSSEPVKPKKSAVRLLALIIGMLLPVSIIVLIELFNDKVTSRNDIEKITDATILGEIGHSAGNETLVVTQGNRKVIAEQFRILRSNLQYVLRNIQKPVILVTSSFSGEGKSFVSTNVGAVLSLMGKKTIILEFDIRKPKVLSHLGLPKRHGLSNFLLGAVNVEDLPMKVPNYDNLFVLPCGPLPPNPAELLLDPKLNDLFAYLKENFDVVVMDTAPVGMVSDAMTLSRFADCTLYIVRQGHTYKKQIGLIDEFYKEGRLPKISLVLNDVKVKSGYGYYGYGRYGYGNGYGYGYGTGYFDDDEQSSSLSKWFGWLGKKNGVDKKHAKRTTKV